MQKRNKTKKAIKVQDLKPKKDAKGGMVRTVQNTGQHGSQHGHQHGPHGN